MGKDLKKPWGLPSLNCLVWWRILSCICSAFSVLFHRQRREISQLGFGRSQAFCLAGHSFFTAINISDPSTLLVLLTNAVTEHRFHGIRRHCSSSPVSHFHTYIPHNRSHSYICFHILFFSFFCGELFVHLVTAFPTLASKRCEFFALLLRQSMSVPRAITHTCIWPCLFQLHLTLSVLNNTFRPFHLRQGS